jgi:hypothetical protein
MDITDTLTTFAVVMNVEQVGLPIQQ